MQFDSLPSSARIENDFEGSRNCSEKRLRKLFLENAKLKEAPQWKIVEDSLTGKIKYCILFAIFSHYGVIAENSKSIKFGDNSYDLLSDGIIDAVASDLGYAIVYRSRKSKLGIVGAEGKYDELLKFGFSVDYDGKINVLNIFKMQIDANNVDFFEFQNSEFDKKNAKCLKCHSESKNRYKILGPYFSRITLE